MTPPYSRRYFNTPHSKIKHWRVIIGSASGNSKITNLHAASHVWLPNHHSNPLECSYIPIKSHQIGEKKNTYNPTNSPWKIAALHQRHPPPGPARLVGRKHRMKRLPREGAWSRNGSSLTTGLESDFGQAQSMVESHNTSIYEMMKSKWFKATTFRCEIRMTHHTKGRRFQLPIAVTIDQTHWTDLRVFPAPAICQVYPYWIVFMNTLIFHAEDSWHRSFSQRFPIVFSRSTTDLRLDQYHKS